MKIELRNSGAAITLLVLLLTPLAIAGQSKPSGAQIGTKQSINNPSAGIRAKILRESSSKVLSVPRFGSYGDSLCDGSGNLFFHHDTGSFVKTDLFQLVSGGQRSVVYRLPPEFRDNSSFLDFNVTPAGHVYELVEQKGTGRFLFSFDSDGSAGGPIRLELPTDVTPESFAAFESGAILVFGYFGRQAKTEMPGKSYVAILDVAGRVVVRLHKGIDGVNLGEIASKPIEGGIKVASDGNAYLLRPKEIVVVSQSGMVVRRIHFTKPDPDSEALRIDVSAGLLSIVLTKIVNHQGKDHYLVLDAGTGDIFGYYEAPAELGFDQVCFSREDGYTFMRYTKNNVELVTADLQ